MRLDGTAIVETGMAGEAAARDAARRIRAARFRAVAVERDTLHRPPNPPFATATLQLAAFRRFPPDPIPDPELRPRPASSLNSSRRATNGASLLITANQPFGEWNKVFPDETTAVAAVDRLVHHATILEMNVESYRRRTALDRRKRGPGRPAKIATED